MRQGANKKLFGLASIMQALCVAALFLVQATTSLTHEDHSHPDALEQVCDYCTIKQGTADLGLASKPALLPGFEISPNFGQLTTDRAAHQPPAKPHSRAPPK